jgi:hypothetical protein
MEIKLEEKTTLALKWIVGILNRKSIPYKIGGGFAAKVYGSPREINDIDISLSGKYFPVLVKEVSDHITAGPKHYLNEKWNCDTLSINYHGQDIDITDVDTLKMTDLEKTKWITMKEIRLFDGIKTNVNGVEVSIMDPRDLVAYKKELGGEHQLIDIKAVEEYMAKNLI